MITALVAVLLSPSASAIASPLSGVHGYTYDVQHSVTGYEYSATVLGPPTAAQPHHLGRHLRRADAPHVAPP